MEEERDFVVFTDDDGNDFELDILFYFEHEDKEYAVLIDAEGEECDCEDEDCCHDTDVYIMQVVVNEADDTEEFISPADEDMEKLIEIVQAKFDEDEECGCGCEECGSECEHK